MMANVIFEISRPVSPTPQEWLFAWESVTRRTRGGSGSTWTVTTMTTTTNGGATRNGSHRSVNNGKLSYSIHFSEGTKGSCSPWFVSCICLDPDEQQSEIVALGRCAHDPDPNPTACHPRYCPYPCQMPTTPTPNTCVEAPSQCGFACVRGSSCTPPCLPICTCIPPSITCPPPCNNLKPCPPCQIITCEKCKCINMRTPARSPNANPAAWKN